MRMTDHFFSGSCGSPLPLKPEGRPGASTAAVLHLFVLMFCLPSVFLCRFSSVMRISWGYLWLEEHGRSNFILISAGLHLAVSIFSVGN